LTICVMPERCFVNFRRVFKCERKTLKGYAVNILKAVGKQTQLTPSDKFDTRRMHFGEGQLYVLFPVVTCPCCVLSTPFWFYWVFGGRNIEVSNVT
jgi:hypothetical protein